MRLPTKPSHTPTQTGTLPMVLPSFMLVARTFFAVFAPRTTSSRRMTFAGLKKCRPITDSGRDVEAAISLMSSVDVLVARMAPALAIASIFPNTSFLTSISSYTASMTISAVAIILKSIDGVISAMRWSICSCESRPLDTVAA